MNRLRIENAPTHADIDWKPFPGGELEGQQPKVLCPECRARKGQQAERTPVQGGKPALCFQCYRAGIARNSKIKAAGELDTASDARFQAALPFEPVNVARLAGLKVAREEARATARAGTGGYVEKRHRAQIEARHALARIFLGLKERTSMAAAPAKTRGSSFDALVQAAELQLPESWLPFVVSQ
jgi:hypothetical protein